MNINPEFHPVDKQSNPMSCISSSFEKQIFTIHSLLDVSTFDGVDQYAWRKEREHAKTVSDRESALAVENARLKRQLAQQAESCRS